MKQHTLCNKHRASGGKTLAAPSAATTVVFALSLALAILPLGAGCSSPGTESGATQNSPSVLHEEVAINDRAGSQGTGATSTSNGSVATSNAAHGAQGAPDVPDASGDKPAQESQTSSVAHAAASSDAAVSNTESQAAAQLQDAIKAATFPTAWLAVDAEGLPGQVPVQLLYLPHFSVEPHVDATTVDADTKQAIWDERGIYASDLALVEYEGAVVAVDANLLLVNMPDLLPEAVYDVVYSYNTNSRCAGQDIPGVTGQRLEGYVEGRQTNAYLGHDQFVVPCAYRTFLNTLPATEELKAEGYRLLVYDAYRPMTAQYYLSDAFAAAYASNPTMQASMGAWSLDWYVASGASGHNFGTDLDVGVCDADGTPLPMPSAFDAFDETGHLTDAPMDNSLIGPAHYCAAVASNEACLALHRAFTNAGFSEVASEWWHFGDLATEGSMRAIVGAGGLDFVATL